MKTSLKQFGAATVACLVVAGLAFATVTFDEATGIGFVGKGDVQSAFGWNNHDAQANYPGVTFSYDATLEYDAVCVWTTGEGTRGEKTHHVTHNTSTVAISSINYDARKVNQVNGFNLTGLGDTTSSGDPIPVKDGPCPGNAGTDGVWESVTLTSSSGGLYVIFNGVKVLLQYN